MDVRRVQALLNLMLKSSEIRKTEVGCFFCYFDITIQQAQKVFPTNYTISVKIPYLTIVSFRHLGKGKQSQSTQRELAFLQLYMSGGMESRALVGHQLNDFIKSCTFGGLECDIDNG